MTHPRKQDAPDGTGRLPAPLPEMEPDPSVLALLRVGTRRGRMGAAVIAVVVGLMAQTANQAYAKARQTVLYLDAPAVSAERAARAGQVAKAYSEAGDPAYRKALAWLHVPVGTDRDVEPKKEQLAAAFASMTAPDAVPEAGGGVTPEAALRAGEVMLAQIGGHSGPESTTDDADAQMAAAGAVRPELGDGLRAPSATPDAKRIAPPATQPDPGAEYASTPAPPSSSGAPAGEPTGAAGIVVPGPSGTEPDGSQSPELAEAPSESGVVPESGSSAGGEPYGATGPISDTGPAPAGESYPSQDDQSPPASEPSTAPAGEEGQLAQTEPSSRSSAGAPPAAPPAQPTGADTGPTDDSGGEIALVPASSPEPSSDPSAELSADGDQNAPSAAPASPFQQNGEFGQEEGFAFAPDQSEGGGGSGQHTVGRANGSGAENGDAALDEEQILVVTGDSTQETSTTEAPSSGPTSGPGGTDQPVATQPEAQPSAQPAAQPETVDTLAPDEDEPVQTAGSQDSPDTTTTTTGADDAELQQPEEIPSEEQESPEEQEGTPAAQAARGDDAHDEDAAPGDDPQPAATTEGGSKQRGEGRPEADRADASREPRQRDDGTSEHGSEHEGEQDRPKPEHLSPMERIGRIEETDGGEAVQRKAQSAVDLSGGKDQKEGETDSSGSSADSRSSQIEPGRQAHPSAASRGGSQDTELRRPESSALPADRSSQESGPTGRDRDGAARDEADSGQDDPEGAEGSQEVSYVIEPADTDHPTGSAGPTSGHRGQTPRVERPIIRVRLADSGYAVEHLNPGAGIQRLYEDDVSYRDALAVGVAAGGVPSEDLRLTPEEMRAGRERLENATPVRRTPPGTERRDEPAPSATERASSAPPLRPDRLAEPPADPEPVTEAPVAEAPSRAAGAGAVRQAASGPVSRRGIHPAAVQAGYEPTSGERAQVDAVAAAQARQERIAQRRADLAAARRAAVERRAAAERAIQPHAEPTTEAQSYEQAVPAPRPAARRWASPAPQVREPALQQQATPAYQEPAPQVGPRPLQRRRLAVPEVTRQQLAPAPRVAAPRLDPAPQVRPQQLPRAPQVRQPAQAQPGGAAVQAAQLTESTDPRSRICRWCS